MSSFTAPFYGKIRRLSVNPSDNTLWMVAEHPNGRSIAPVQFDIQALLDGQSTNDTTKSFEIKGVASEILGHNTGLYVSSEDGVIHRLNTAGGFDAVYTCASCCSTGQAENGVSCWDGYYSAAKCCADDSAHTASSHTTSDAHHSPPAHSSPVDHHSPALPTAHQQCASHVPLASWSGCAQSESHGRAGQPKFGAWTAMR